MKLERFQKGDIKLVDAYTDLNKDSKIESMANELAELKEKLGITTKNIDNQAASTGSVTGNGSTDTVFSREQVKSMSKSDIKKNYPKIIKDMKSWK